MCPEAFGIFDHLIGRDGIESSLLVAGRVVEHEEALGKAIDLALEDVDRAIDLGDEFLRIEVPIAILPWFEHDAGLSVVIAQASPLCCQEIRDHE